VLTDLLTGLGFIVETCKVMGFADRHVYYVGTHRFVNSCHEIQLGASIVLLCIALCFSVSAIAAKHHGNEVDNVFSFFISTEFQPCATDDHSYCAADGLSSPSSMESSVYCHIFTIHNLAHQSCKSTLSPF
jgi:hypothetical protein